MKANLLLEISNITLEIETNYPELYQYLDENPITIPSEDNLNVDDNSLKNYLETLKIMLKKHKEEHS
ncbi:hypothetical protein [Mariniflexile sp. HMF6888]|uniref:hypothetical protein n=1 Tax=Mariniflexile sp. HMF6888 TaxID=3373086 RepID=UPI0037BC6122